MNELVNQIGREGPKPITPQEFTLERCGLCCVLIPTTTFSKEGIVCKHLLPEGDATRCAIYSSRPEECRSFSCNYPSMVERLDYFIMQIINGQGSVIYYVDPDGDYKEYGDPFSALKRMKELNLLRHSSIIERLHRDGQIPLPPELRRILVGSDYPE